MDQCSTQARLADSGACGKITIVKGSLGSVHLPHMHTASCPRAAGKRSSMRRALFEHFARDKSNFARSSIRHALIRIGQL